MKAVKTKDAEFLKKWRDARDLSQAALGKHLGVTGNTIARWERGEMATPKFLKLALIGLELELEKKEESS